MAELSLQETDRQNQQLPPNYRLALQDLSVPDRMDGANLRKFKEEIESALGEALRLGIGRQVLAYTRLLPHIVFEESMRNGGNPSEFGLTAAEAQLQDFRIEELDAVPASSVS